jgi:uncharacterized MAPEG superfamily protein
VGDLKSQNLDNLFQIMHIPLPSNLMLLYGITAAAALVYFPYIFVAYERLNIGMNLSAPRAMFDKLPPYAQRATWAHQNSLEIFMIFAAAALMVYVSGAASDRTSLFVIAFLVLRFGYSISYITDIPILRSLCWASSVACIMGLMLASFTALAA